MSPNIHIGQSLRRHWLLAVLVAAGTLLRVLATVAYRPAIVYIDSLAVYLPNVDSFTAVTPDPLGYDILLLRPILAVAHLSTVTVAQHLIGLAMGVTLYAFLVHKGAWRWLAGLAAAPVLLDAYQVQIEQNIMPDLLFQGLLVAGLTTLGWSPRPGPRAVVISGLLLGAAVTVRVVGLPVLLAALVYVLLTTRWWRRRAILALVMAACFGLPVVAYGGYAWHQTGRFSLSSAGGFALYGRVATFADCTGLALPADERVLCPVEPLGQRYGPDFYAHDPRSPVWQVRDTAEAKALDAVTDFSLRLLRHQPLGLAGAVAGDAVKLFSWQHSDDANPEAPTERWRFQTTFPTYPALVTLDSIAAVDAHYGDGPPAISVPLATFLRDYQLTVGYTPGPVLALALLIALAALVRRRRSPIWAVVALYLSTAVLVLLFADLFEFSWRYQLPGLVLIPVAGALGLVALRNAPDGSARPGDASEPVGFPEPVDVAALADFRDRYGEPALPPVAVVIAAYHEEASLGRVIDALPGNSCGLELATIVVVDGGHDATAQVAAAHGAYTCVAAVNRGQGAALRLGYFLARAGGARFIVSTDADDQYDLAQLPVLLEPLLAGRADFVTGSRRLGVDQSTDLVRRAGTRVFARLVSILTGHTVTDTSFGFRAMRAEVTAAVTLDEPQYQSSELLVGVLSRGFRVLEVPMTMQRRREGRSKKGNNLVYGSRYARVVLRTWWRERRGRTTRFFPRSPPKGRNTTRSSSTNLTTNSNRYVLK
jgi:uncharacterized protein (TIGR03382 family)